MSAPGQVQENPFPGLRPYQMEEAHLFFGMEAQVDELLQVLRTHRFIAVTGSSGSGKSSLVRAGLLPSLFTGFMVSAGPNWRLAVMRPGDNPIGNLAEALVQPHALGGDEFIPPEVQKAFTETSLRRSDLGLVEAVKQARMKPGENLLVVVDQFEEIFRFKNQSQLAGAYNHAVGFIKLLLEAAKQSEVSLYIVLTMRSDYLGECNQFEGLPEAINRGHYLVRRMTREERKTAITGPVAVAGGKIANRLLMRLLNDAGDNPDQLPILQHALMRTWDHWTTGKPQAEAMDLSHYEAVGTMAHALNQHADEAFAELKTDSLRLTCEKIFRALTERGSGTSGIRLPTAFGELCRVTQANEKDVRTVLDTFRKPGRSFLMPSLSTPLQSDTLVDISHESLMRVWDRMNAWVEQEIQSASIYLQIAESARLHKAGQRGLWRDPELSLAFNWRQENAPNAAWASRYDPAFEESMQFLDESRAAMEEEKAAAAARSRRELRRARVVALVLGGAALVSVFMLVLAIRARTVALEAKAIADEQRMRAEENENRAKLAEAHVRDALDSVQVERDKVKSEYTRAESLRLLAEQKETQARIAERRANELRDTAMAAQARAIRSFADSERDRKIAVDAAKEALRQEEIARKERKGADSLRRLALSRVVANQAVVQLRSGNDSTLGRLLAVQARKLNLATGGSEFNADIFRALVHAGPKPIEMRDERKPAMDEVECLVLSPDGKKLISGSKEGRVRLWHTQSLHEPPLVLKSIASPGAFNSVKTVSFGLNDERILAGFSNGIIAMWDRNNPSAPPFEILAHRGGVNKLVSATSRLAIMFSCGNDSTLKIWSNAAENKIILANTVPLKEKATNLAWSYQLRRIAVLTVKGQVLVYQFEGNDLNKIQTLDLPGARCLAFDSTGTRLACGSSNGSATVFTINPDKTLGSKFAFRGPASPVNALAFSHSNRVLATAYADRNVRLWDMRYPDEDFLLLSGHSHWVTDVSFSPDSEKIYTASADHTLRCWTILPRVVCKWICNHVNRDLSQEEWDHYIGSDIEKKEVCNE